MELQSALPLAFFAGQPPVQIALCLAFLVLSLGVHEAAHGWVAYKCGDPTARDLGRISLNPVVHIDPFMTIVLPLMLLYVSGGRFMFGGAKPVPVNFYNLRKGHFHMALVALAGPASNFLLAVFFALCSKVLVYELRVWEPGVLGHNVLLYTTYFNLLLAAFNLLPIPPLDGSRVMTWLLPAGLREPYARLEGMGLILVFAFIFIVPGGSAFVVQMIELLETGVLQIVNLGGLW